MKQIILLIMVVFLAGCDIGDEINSDSLGPLSIFAYEDNNVNHSPIVFNSSLAVPMLPECAEHQYWNKFRNSCVCESGYNMEDNVCISNSFRECVFDKDCSPDGVLGKCDDAYFKRSYYCHNFRCVGGKDIGTVVDCSKEYGPSSRCVDGLCS